MTQSRREPPSRRLGKSLVIFAASSALAVTGCGGGSGQDATTPPASSTPAAITPTPSPLTPPTDKATALDYQYQAVVETRKAVEAILAGNDTALQALFDGRYADWDRYWTTEYPALLGRMETATEDLQQSENHIHKFVYGLGPVYTKEVASEKWVPIPVILIAITVTASIWADWIKRAQELQPPDKDAAEHDARVKKLAGVYERKGLTPVAAQTRAIADLGKVKIKRGVDTGLRQAGTSLVDQVGKPLVGAYGPAVITVPLEVSDAYKTLTDFKRDVDVIATPRKCRDAIKPKAPGGGDHVLHPERSALTMPLAKSVATKEEAADGCRIYFCSTKDGTCPNLPIDEWEVAVFAPGHLRGTDGDVVSAPGGPVSIQATLVPAADIGAPPPVAQCSKVQNAGGDQADTRNVPLGATSGSFTLTYEMWSIKDRIRVLYDGAPLFDSGCVGNGKTQLIPYSGLASFVTIQVEPNCTGTTSGTAWNYTVACPAAN